MSYRPPPQRRRRRPWRIRNHLEKAGHILLHGDRVSQVFVTPVRQAVEHGHDADEARGQVVLVLVNVLNQPRQHQPRLPSGTMSRYSGSTWLVCESRA